MPSTRTMLSLWSACKWVYDWIAVALIWLIWIFREVDLEVWVTTEILDVLLSSRSLTVNKICTLTFSWPDYVLICFRYVVSCQVLHRDPLHILPNNRFQLFRPLFLAVTNCVSVSFSPCLMMSFTYRVHCFSELSTLCICASSSPCFVLCFTSSGSMFMKARRLHTEWWIMGRKISEFETKDTTVDLAFAATVRDEGHIRRQEKMEDSPSTEFKKKF